MGLGLCYGLVLIAQLGGGNLWHGTIHSVIAQCRAIARTTPSVHTHVYYIHCDTCVDIDDLEEKLEREQVQRVAETANHSDQAKGYQRTILEVRIERDETQAKLVQLREVSVSNKKEVCTFLCACMHTYTYKHTHVHIHTRIHVHT